MAWHSGRSEPRRDQLGETHIIEADNADIFGRMDVSEDLPSIFKPFYQAANNRLIGQGVGLGLHISKQIVDLLGGKISVVSELDRGSTFTFEIPWRDAKPPSPEETSPQIVSYAGPRRKRQSLMSLIVTLRPHGREPRLWWCGGRAGDSPPYLSNAQDGNQ
jgi:hypothetical protein